MTPALSTLLTLALTSSAAVPGAHHESDRTDHQRVVERLGIGWFGVSTIFVGTGGDTVVAPSVGVRYWLDESFGIDGAVGFNFQDGGATQTTAGMTMESDSPSTFGFLLHAGVPIALYSAQHYTFLVVPELNVGYARVGTEIGNPMMPMRQSERGFRLDLGARAGAEIHFGFIGVPSLALEASVGLMLSHQRVSFSIGDASSGRVATTTLRTLSVNDPWDFFRSTVAARYYF
jgi:hypothetical protein